MVTMRHRRLRFTMRRRRFMRGLDIHGLEDIGIPLALATIGTPVIGLGRLMRADAGTLRAITTIAIIQATGAATNEPARVSAV